MSADLDALIAAAIAFVGSHLLLSGPLRAPLVRSLGARGFMAVYSLVALATFAAMAVAFRRVEPGAPLWDGTATAPWLAASLLTIVALALFLGSFKSNPALPDAPVADLAGRVPTGAFRVSRHPMMMSFALWGLAHTLVAPTGRTIVLCLAVIALALLGAHHQDRRKRAALGAGWQAWMAKTTFWPRLGALPGLGLLWLAGLVTWLAITWAHIPGVGMAAGIWRWVG